jgi:hypothetical protein
LDEELARLALGCVALMVPGHDADEWWLTQRRLLLHVARCDPFVRNHELSTTGMEWELHTLGDLHAAQSKHRKAEEMYLRALQGNEETLSMDHVQSYPPALNTMRNMGMLYAELNKT